MKKFVIMLLSLFLMTGCEPVSKVRILKLGHVLETSHPVHRAMMYMAEKVAEKSGGMMRVDIYPGGQLGQERDLIELLQIGSLAMTKVSTAPLEAFVPEMMIFGIPYLFRDDDHRWKVLNSQLGKELLLSGQKFFLRGLCYYDAGNRSFYTKNVPILSPADLKGLKIRVMKSITSVDMMKALGGSSTPISWGELYTSLQQGVVDGAENNPPSFHLSYHYEVCKYYCLDEHTAVPDILLISTEIWKKLTPQEQIWLQEAVDESVEYQKILWKEACDKAFATVQAAGVEVIRPDKALFKQAVMKIYDSYKGKPIYDLIQQIENMR